jgi:hypothetical protein
VGGVVGVSQLPEHLYLRAFTQGQLCLCLLLIVQTSRALGWAGERSRGIHKQLGCNIQMVVLFSHAVTLHWLVNADSSTACVGHRRPSSGASIYCSKLVHCIIPLLSEALINIKD